MRIIIISDYSDQILPYLFFFVNFNYRYFNAFAANALSPGPRTPIASSSSPPTYPLFTTILIAGTNGIIKTNGNLIKFIKNIYYSENSTDDNKKINNLKQHLTWSINNNINAPSPIPIPTGSSVEITSTSYNTANYREQIINPIVNIYEKYIIKTRGIFKDILLQLNPKCADENNIETFVYLNSNTSKPLINVYSKLTTCSPDNDIYKQLDIINEDFETLMKDILNYLNVGVQLPDNSKFNVFKNNYNDYNDNKDKIIEVKPKAINYETYDYSNDNESNDKDNIATVQLSSFILFGIIIFILLETLYIEQ